MTKRMLAAVAGIALAGTAEAKIRTQEIAYQQGDTVLQGFLAWNDAAQGRRPGVLVVHEWWGNNRHARNQARRLAEAGYVGFALDMYGKGKVTTHPEDATKFVAEATKDAARMRARFDAARTLLARRPEVDPKRIAAIGYCFGGAVALQMAREGEPLAAVATFHAALRPPEVPARKGKVRAPILVQTGGADPMVPPEAVAAFEKEMKAAGARLQVITYPGAKHSFTNPDADARSWKALLAFFRKTLDVR